MWAGLTALILAAAFTSAAFYINFAEHPARMAISPGQAVLQWRVAYKRGFVMQSLIAVVGGVLSLWQGHLSHHEGWALAGLLMLANWPYTLLVIMPTNRLLMARGVEDTARASVLLVRWNQLHAGRTFFGFAALAVMMAVVMR